MGLFSIFWLAARTAPGLRLSQDGLPSHSSRGEPAFALLCRIQSVFAFASLKLRRTPRFALLAPRGLPSHSSRAKQPAFAKRLRRGSLHSLRERRLVGLPGLEPAT